MTETVAVPAKTEAPKKRGPAQGTTRVKLNKPVRSVDPGSPASTLKNALAIRTRALRGARPKAVAPPAPTFTALAKRAHPLKKRANG